MNIRAFATECKFRELPYYAAPRVNSNKLLDYYAFLPLTVKRNVSTKGIKREQVVRISSKLQGAVLESILTMKKIVPYTIVISSEPNDYVAMEVATSIIHALTERLKEDWSCLRIGKNKLEGEGKILLMYNILPEKDRLYVIRDAILEYASYFKIIVIGGTTGIDFFDNFLRLPVSGALHVSGNGKLKSIIKGLKHETDDNYPVFSKDFNILTKVQGIVVK